MAWSSDRVRQFLRSCGCWGSELTVHLRASTGFKGCDGVAWSIRKSRTVDTCRGCLVSALTVHVRVATVVADGLLLSAMTFQPLAGCSPHAAFFVSEPQVGHTAVMGGKSSNKKEFKKVLLKIHDSSASDSADPFSLSGHVGAREAGGGRFTVEGFCGALAVPGGVFPDGETRPGVSLPVWLS